MTSFEVGESYKVYPSRWGVLMAVFFLNLANNALWISYSSVSNLTADYYQTGIIQVDLLSSIGFFVGIPFCLLSTIIIDKLGLRVGVYFGTILTFAGGMTRFISTLPGVRDSLSKNTQFWLAFSAQTMVGMGNPLAVSMPTEVSQGWFPESQRTLATITLAMSLPLGIMLGQGVTPLFVKSADDVPIMNWVWMIPSAIAMILCIVFVRASKPPTPPSKSAEFDVASLPYFQSMKSLMTNKSYLFINLAIGGAIGFFNCFATQLQQFMCARGYPDTFSGLCGSLLLGSGFLGSFLSGVLTDQTGKMEEIVKIFYCMSGIIQIFVSQFLRKPDQNVMLAILCSLVGVFGFGMYPIGLELSVEATYPINQAAGTALIFLSGQVQGGILVAISSALEQDLTEEASLIEACGGQGKDHTRFLLLISGYFVMITIIFVFGLNVEYKRRKANQKSNGENKVEAKDA